MTLETHNLHTALNGGSRRQHQESKTETQRQQAAAVVTSVSRNHSWTGVKSSGTLLSLLKKQTQQGKQSFLLLGPQSLLLLRLGVWLPPAAITLPSPSCFQEILESVTVTGLDWSSFKTCLFLLERRGPLRSTAMCSGCRWPSGG